MILHHRLQPSESSQYVTMFKEFYGQQATYQRHMNYIQFSYGASTFEYVASFNEFGHLSEIYNDVTSTTLNIFQLSFIFS